MQEQKQEPNYAPGFLEWRKAEEERIIKQALDQIKKEEQLAKDKTAAAIGCPMYYSRLAKEAHKNWSDDGFKQGPLRDAYMEAQAALAVILQRQ